MDIIRIQNVYKNFSQKLTSNVEVLRGITLSIQKGDMVAVKGSSGAGKSTLLHILGCLDVPTKGEYYLDDVDVTRFGARQLAKVRNKKIGFVMQSFGLILEETVLENVKLPLYFSDISFDKAEGCATEMLQKFGIENLAKRKVMQLSGGEKQRVAIARALINKPDIILADEPTGALDSKNSEMIMDIFENLNKEGKTIVIVTHEDYVAKRCNRVVSISDGVIG